MAVTITDIKYSQSTQLLDSSFSSSSSTKKNKESNALSTLVKNDILDISAQVDLLNSQSSKKIDYSAIEKKLGIDSSQWGVEAVSDDIFNFAKIMYENYKLNHNGEEDSKVLENFYNMAKDSITQGYNEAKNFLGAMHDDVATLAEGTFTRSLEKLDAWFKNGGKDVETTEDSAGESSSTETAAVNSTDEKSTKLTTSELLQESENIKNQIIKMLEEQGIYLKGMQSKKDSSEKQSKSSIDIKI